MKEYRFNFLNFIVGFTIAVISISAAIILFAVPSYLLDAKNGFMFKMIFGSLAAFFGVIFLILSIDSINKEKQRVEYLNNLIKSAGDNAIFFKGIFIDKESFHENIKKTAVSFAIAYVFALIFGFGIYRISWNEYPFRLFIISDDVLFIVNPQTLSKIEYSREYKKNFVSTQKKNGKVAIKFTELDFCYIINTKNCEVGQEQLINKLNELFKQKNVKRLESHFDEVQIN